MKKLFFAFLFLISATAQAQEVQTSTKFLELVDASIHLPSITELKDSLEPIADEGEEYDPINFADQ